ncbi:hypothetical protein bcgnr5394_16380 [Bacillus cereus]|nr:hypothetical protein BCJMU10_2023 [Bacillus cereus]
MIERRIFGTFEEKEYYLNHQKAFWLDDYGNDIPKRLSEFSCTKIYVLKNIKNVIEF